MPATAVVATAKPFALPTGVFDKKATNVKPPSSPVPTIRALPLITAPVMLYASPATQAYFAKTDVDGKVNVRVWEAFLRKYKIPFQIVTSVEQLEKSQSRVIVLPSSVVLTDREKQAVIAFRAKGGGVLSSWLTGVRSEAGEWLGFGFMDSALGAKVVGNTEASEQDNFMMLDGDSPVLHSLPAGQRVWFDRIKDWYPLRLAGNNSVAQIMDWSRTVTSEKNTGVVVFDERSQSSGQLSRSVVLGYAEPLWLAADPKLLEAIAHNALSWLLRQPDVHVAAWPYPYSSAFVMTVQVADVVSNADVDFAKKLESVGARGTYYVLSDDIDKSAELLNKILTRGHELAYSADKFEGFKDQPTSVQTKRLETMRSGIRASSLPIRPDAGFAAPMDSFDKTTEKLLQQGPFGHYITHMGATDARVPFFAALDAARDGVVVLPRTLKGPEDSLEEDDPEVGFNNFLGEFDLSVKMGGLSIVGIPNQSLLPQEQIEKLFDRLKANKGRMWLSTSGVVADWWRERSRISARLESHVRGPLLIVTVTGKSPLKFPATILVNLPQTGGGMRLEAADADEETPPIMRVDAWRSAVVLDGLSPGEYCWYVQFDGTTAPLAR